VPGLPDLAFIAVAAAIAIMVLRRLIRRVDR
jgi:hypothetical protein